MVGEYCHIILIMIMLRIYIFVFILKPCIFFYKYYPYWCHNFRGCKLFISPWFPDFDPNTMVVTKMSVWVRLPNLPLHFCHKAVLTDIGNNLGKFIKIDQTRYGQNLFTYSWICIEVNLSRGLPDKIILKHGTQNYTQPLDYENTTFRCRICHQTGLPWTRKLCRA